ncbi:hypothetical protein VIBNISFn27_220085 [Vibrio nigripulchritudo SFn27]|nr:hypothetical protein VIBNISFn27_220085 [Vibrio nigripulchritudo SFn27]
MSGFKETEKMWNVEAAYTIAREHSANIKKPVSHHRF